jgi:hypothetical protein
MMPEFTTPRTDYVAESPVTPTIFNTLGSNEIVLYEIRCPVEKQTGDAITQINGIVLVDE